MKRYGIPEEECISAMTRVALDMLTVIDPAQVEKGIKWVKREIKLRSAQAGVFYSVEKWGEFWSYFDRTWNEQYSIDVWNVFDLNNELVARTNNPLERFNRELKRRFPAAHPSMATFVTVIKTISAEYVRGVADVPRGRARRVPRELIQLSQPVEIPSDIESDLEDEAAAAFPTSDTALPLTTGGISL
ncbi:hypothetical protein PC129_g19944 [Phytophthora cactorum]|uniref:Uncharacterized protein n=1 Tax=Phytophthora cactorum TaxID=29920 RepID=A0A329SN45_9STRA|nr:hypothetical protein Pcac1_g6370 [Phytophthora cactorum]KAG2803837.1 hypothetical protein PC112_g18992 [Phytophthora cactorum]KAG2804558.1 hypothetical protein PC111_g18207 [Phytophthora cactorum]KAG2832926.1 hypothetical protein PC113_g20666 [Phytophthora cactorum]KAG2878795.1 hypothetical protein PC114_g22903 [Phytophthora cactorum]